MSRMHVLCEKGDIVVEWEPDDRKSVDNAKGEWKRLKADGYEFYKRTEGGRGERVTRFDKTLERVIAAPGVKKPAERKTSQRPKAMAGGPLTELVR